MPAYRRPPRADAVGLIRILGREGGSEAFIVTGRRGKKATDPETGRVFTDNSG